MAFMLVMIAVVTISSAFAQAAKPKELQVIRVPDIYSISSVYDLYVAEDAGIFAKYGLKAVFTGVIGPGQHLPSVVGGSNDVGGMMIDRTISGIASGAPVTAVVTLNSSQKDRPTYEFDTLEDSPIHKPADLIGKKIGVLALGGPHTYPVILWLKKAGISRAQSKIEFVILPNIQQQEQALRNKQVDVAAFIGDPVEVKKHGSIRTIFSTYDAFGETLLAPYYFSNKFIAEKPEVVKSFVKALKETGAWINAHPKEALAFTAKHYKVDPSKLNAPTKYDTSGIIDEKLVQVWIDLLREDGTIKKDIKPSEVITNKFNDGSVPKL